MNTKMSLTLISALLLALITAFIIVPAQTLANEQTTENADNAQWKEFIEDIEENSVTEQEPTEEDEENTMMEPETTEDDEENPVTEPETTENDENAPIAMPFQEMLSEEAQEETMEQKNTNLSVIQVSSYTELSEAINNVSTDGTLYIIEVMDDIDFAGTLIIAAGKNIIIMTDENNPTAYELTRKNVSNTGRHFTVSGTLTLINIVLDGDRENKTSASGGVYVNASGIFNLNDGAVIENCSNTTSSEGGGITVLGKVTVNGGIIRNCTKNMTNGGGGVYLPSGSAGSFTMNYGAICNNISNASNAYGCGIVSFSSGTITINDGEIYGNTCSGSSSSGYGGGISVSSYTVLNINGGDIYENTASNNGGGVYVTSNATFNMTGGTIRNNKTNTSGGGIYINTSVGANISGATISGNTATGSHGGGIYIVSASFISINNSTISNNTATNGNGGGIYTANTTYGNLTTAADTIFTGNMAAKAYAPPSYADTTYTNIGFSDTSITNHPLNNYDINYTSGSVINTANFMVSFDSQGGSSVKDQTVLYGKTFAVQEEPVKYGYDFTGWYTDKDCTGLYDFNVPVTGNTTLYAGWTVKEYTVTFNNGEEVTTETVIHGETIDEPEAPVRDDYDFTGWYMDAECTKPFDLTEPITGDITLYAGWTVKTDDDEFIAIDDMDDTDGTDGGSVTSGSDGPNDNGGLYGNSGVLNGSDSGSSNGSISIDSGADAILSDGSNVTGYFNPSTGQWDIYGSDGVPLGSIDVPEDQTLQETLLSGEMNPLGGFDMPSKEYAPTTEDQKINPKTGNHQPNALLYLIIALAATVIGYLKTRSNSKFP